MPKRQPSSSSSEDESSDSQIIKYVSVNVSKLTPNVTQQHLYQIFSHFATVKNVFLSKGPKLTSTALIQFEKKEEAQLAIRYMNKGFIDGSRIVVQHESETLKVEKPVEKKSPEKAVKTKRIQKQRRRSRSYDERDKRDRHRQGNRDKERNRGRDRYERYDRRREKQRSRYEQKRSSSSSSSAVSSSASSSQSRSSRS